MSKDNKYQWIRDGLKANGYTQADLARVWDSQPASVSRFFSGEELQDPPLSKMVTLAGMLDAFVSPRRGQCARCLVKDNPA